MSNKLKKKSKISETPWYSMAVKIDSTKLDSYEKCLDFISFLDSEVDKSHNSTIKLMSDVSKMFLYQEIMQDSLIHPGK